MAMLSRVAAHLYWMARYLERGENTARLINANGSLILDLPREIRPGWASLIAITGSQELFYQSHSAMSEGQVIRFLIGDANNPGSILSSLRYARENARTIRDIFPREAWEQINELYLKSSDKLADGLSARRRYAYLKEVILGVQQLAGIVAGTMSHDAGYEFYRLGLNLERADMTTRIIDVRYEDYEPEKAEALRPFENILWMGVLKSLAAYQMYRRHRQGAVHHRDVVEFLLEFLLKDRTFPRSTLHCLLEADECLHHLPRSAEPLSVLGPLLELLAKSNPDKLSPSELHQFIDELQIRLGDVHSAINTCYFEASAAAGKVTDGRSQAA